VIKKNKSSTIFLAFDTQRDAYAYYFWISDSTNEHGWHTTATTDSLFKPSEDLACAKAHCQWPSSLVGAVEHYPVSKSCSVVYLTTMNTTPINTLETPISVMARKKWQVYSLSN
jgi:hypothetical protein